MRRLLSSRCCSTSSRERILVVMGATGTGKSKLSIDLSLRLSPPAEIINSDKIQVYSGLDLTTNKVSPMERAAVRHHLLGELDPAAGELSAAGFRSLGGAAVSEITSRRRLPIIAGGSNSFIHALLVDDYDPAKGFCGAAAFRYRACVLWVDVAAAVLRKHLDKRVEEMVAGGMVAELAAAYDPWRRRRGYVGLWKAIGVPEFDRYFEKIGGGVAVEKAAYEEAVAAVKESTWRLAVAQVGKIRRLMAGGWRMRRVDATAAVAAALEKREKEEVEEIWERDVVKASLAAVEEFLDRETEEEEKTAAAADEEILGRQRTGELLG